MNTAWMRPTSFYDKAKWKLLNIDVELAILHNGLSWRIRVMDEVEASPGYYFLYQDTTECITVHLR